MWLPMATLPPSNRRRNGTRGLYRSCHRRGGVVDLVAACGRTHDIPVASCAVVGLDEVGGARDADAPLCVRQYDPMAARQHARRRCCRLGPPPGTEGVSVLHRGAGAPFTRSNPVLATDNLCTEKMRHAA